MGHRRHQRIVVGAEHRRGAERSTERRKVSASAAEVELQDGSRHEIPRARGDHA